MTDPNLRLVCEVAAAWAGEYGFTEPERARAVILAVYSVDPDALEPRDRHWAASQTTPCPICVSECPDCSQHGTYEARILINGRGVYTCPEGHRWQDINEKPSDKGIPLSGSGGAS